MKKLLGYANEYLDVMDLYDVSLLKVCLCSIGVLIGLNVPKGKKKPAAMVATVLFALTYLLLMVKFVQVILGCFARDRADYVDGGTVDDDLPF